MFVRANRHKDEPMPKYSADQIEVIQELRARLNRRARNMVRLFNSQLEMDLAQLEPGFMNASVQLRFTHDSFRGRNTLTTAGETLHQAIVEILSANEQLFEDVLSKTLIEAGQIERLQQSSEDQSSEEPLSLPTSKVNSKSGNGFGR
jgi:hypothetical protein